MLKRLLVVAVMVTLFTPSSLLADPQKEAEAGKAVSTWHSVVDAGKYIERWTFCPKTGP